MAKTDRKPDSAAVAPLTVPRMGEAVMVQLVPGAELIHPETGGRMEPDVPALLTVTATLLRRLSDGDLVLV